MVRHDREAQTGRQHHGEQNLDAFPELPRRRLRALRASVCTAIGNKGRRDADRRNDQRLIGEVGRGDVLAGLGYAGEMGNDETVDDAGQREEGQGHRQRHSGFQQREQTVAVKGYRRAAPDRRDKEQDADAVGQAVEHSSTTPWLSNTPTEMPNTETTIARMTVALA